MSKTPDRFEFETLNAKPVPYAYVAVVLSGGAASIGRADEGVPGYTPTSFVFLTYPEAQAHAAKLNAERGLDPKTVGRIVLSTMFPVSR